MQRGGTPALPEEFAIVELLESTQIPVRPSHDPAGAGGGQPGSNRLDLLWDVPVLTRGKSFRRPETPWLERSENTPRTNERTTA